MLIGLTIVLVFVIGFAFSGDGTATGNMFIRLGFPLLMVMAFAEGGARLWRRLHGA